MERLCERQAARETVTIAAEAQRGRTKGQLTRNSRIHMSKSRLASWLLTRRAWRLGRGHPRHRSAASKARSLLSGHLTQIPWGMDGLSNAWPPPLWERVWEPKSGVSGGAPGGRGLGGGQGGGCLLASALCSPCHDLGLVRICRSITCQP